MHIIKLRSRLAYLNAYFKINAIASQVQMASSPCCSICVTVCGLGHRLVFNMKANVLGKRNTCVSKSVEIVNFELSLKIRVVCRKLNV